MPYRKRKSYKRRPKRRYPSKRRKRRSQPIIKVGKSLLPANRLYSLRYCDTININPGLGGVTGTHLYRANHIYDPDATAGGHQPFGHDEIAQFFNHYTVVGSKINVRFQGISSADNYECGVYLSEDATLLTDTTWIREYQKGTHCFISGSSKQLGTAVAKYSAKRFFGVGSATSSDKLWGTFGSVPDAQFDQAYYHVWSAGAGGVDEAPIYCHITIDYIIKVKEPTVLSQS